MAELYNINVPGDGSCGVHAQILAAAIEYESRQFQLKVCQNALNVCHQALEELIEGNNTGHTVSDHNKDNKEGVIQQLIDAQILDGDTKVDIAAMQLTAKSTELDGDSDNRAYFKQINSFYEKLGDSFSYEKDIENLLTFKLNPAHNINSDYKKKPWYKRLSEAHVTVLSEFVTNDPNPNAESWNEKEKPNIESIKVKYLEHENDATDRFDIDEDIWITKTDMDYFQAMFHIDAKSPFSSENQQAGQIDIFVRPKNGDTKSIENKPVFRAGSHWTVDVPKNIYENLCSKYNIDSNKATTFTRDDKQIDEERKQRIIKAIKTYQDSIRTSGKSSDDDWNKLLTAIPPQFIEQLNLDKENFDKALKELDQNNMTNKEEDWLNLLKAPRKEGAIKLTATTKAEAKAKAKVQNKTAEQKGNSLDATKDATETDEPSGHSSATEHSYDEELWRKFIDALKDKVKNVTETGKQVTYAIDDETGHKASIKGSTINICPPSNQALEAAQKAFDRKKISVKLNYTMDEEGLEGIKKLVKKFKTKGDDEPSVTFMLGRITWNLTEDQSNEADSKKILKILDEFLGSLNNPSLSDLRKDFQSSFQRELNSRSKRSDGPLATVKHKPNPQEGAGGGAKKITPR